MTVHSETLGQWMLTVSVLGLLVLLVRTYLVRGTIDIRTILLLAIFLSALGVSVFGTL